MFIIQLKKIFIIIILLSSSFLFYSLYKNYKFNNNVLNEKIINQIKTKELHLKKLILQKFNLHVDFPIIISNNLNSNLFGLASYGENEDIKIVLNKKRFKESLDYMINDVLPHEYAHAMIFKLKIYSNEDKGHSKAWIKMCKILEGLKCERFVNNADIVFGKTKF